MRFGIGSPIVTFSNPDSWERKAGPKDLADIATAADRLGFWHMTCSEHIAVPDGPYAGFPFWDPVATFGYLAAVTERIRFVTYVLILGLHHPLAIAKQYGTVDMISGGRLVLGLGVGNVEEEFDALGASFADRGARADDALLALKATLSRRSVSYHGPYYHYDQLIVDPHAVQPSVPLWIGGHSRRSFVRAVELGDAWIPPPAAHRGPTPTELAAMVATTDLPERFDIGVSADAPMDPMSQSDHCLDAVERWRQAGATVMTVAFVHESAAHYVEQLEAFAALIGLEAAAAPDAPGGLR
jgi:probable F420-dependent oxidoreductase